MKKYLIILIILFLTGCVNKEYKVTISLSDGTLLDSFNIIKGDNLEDYSDPYKDGYIFVNYLKDGIEYDKEKPINEDINLIAKFISVPEVVEKYDITFDFGDESKIQTVLEGDTLDEPKEPKKDKYSFIGWYKDDLLYDFNEPVFETFTLKAKYEKVIFMVKYEISSGSGVLSQEVKKGSILERPKDPEKIGYRFVEWTLDGEVYDFNKPVLNDITLKAVYEPIKYYTISFDTDGGDNIKSIIVSSLKDIKSLPIPNKKGYIFKYWTYLDKEFNKDMNLTSNITLKALYEIDNK